MTAAGGPEGHVYHWSHGWIPLDHEDVRRHDVHGKDAIDRAAHATADIPDVGSRHLARQHLAHADSARRNGDLGEMGRRMKTAASFFGSRGGRGHRDQIAKELRHQGGTSASTFPKPPAASPPTGRAMPTGAPAGPTSAAKIQARIDSKVKHPPGSTVSFRQPGGTHQTGKVTGVDGSHRVIEARSIGGVGTSEHRIHVSQISPVK